jgi:hypothetical protein
MWYCGACGRVYHGYELHWGSHAQWTCGDFFCGGTVMSLPIEYKRGDQIAYIPAHAQGDPKHPDVQFGFVTSFKNGTAWCRYWYNAKERARAGIEGNEPEMRTTAISEGTMLDNLFPIVTVEKYLVEEWLAKIDLENEVEQRR